MVVAQLKTMQHWLMLSIFAPAHIYLLVLALAFLLLWVMVMELSTILAPLSMARMAMHGLAHLKMARHSLIPVLIGQLQLMIQTEELVTVMLFSVVGQMMKIEHAINIAPSTASSNQPRISACDDF